MADRDLTDLGLVDYQPLYEAEVARRKAALRKIPRQRVPAEEPASRPDLHSARIYRCMGWTKDPRKSRPCASCLARPGAPCVTDTGKRMDACHPGR